MKVINSKFLFNLSNYCLSEVENLIILLSNKKNTKKNSVVLSDFNFILANRLELEEVLDLLEEIANEKTALLIDCFLKEEAFTIEETANYLNVSEPYIVKLLERGTIPFQKIDNNIVIKMHDIFEYDNCLVKRQNRLLEELAKQAQELNLGY